MSDPRRAAALLPAAGMSGLVSQVLPFSCVDGPGNRFVVFLQGCNFDCIACHNPHTINVCNHCGECVAQCPSGALGITATGLVHWDPDACTGSDACTTWCPYDSTPKARLMPVPELMADVRRTAPFLSGVTVSGGEATQQPRFVHALFSALAEDPVTARLTRFVDSNGSCPASVWDELDPVMDAAMIDLKALDDDLHQRMTGRSNADTLASIRLLAERSRLHEVRLLIVPGVNDGADLIARTAVWLHTVDPWMRVRVIGFRCHGVRPHPDLGADAAPEQLRAIADLLHAEGLHNVTTV